MFRKGHGKVTNTWPCIFREVTEQKQFATQSIYRQEPITVSVHFSVPAMRRHIVVTCERRRSALMLQEFSRVPLRRPIHLVISFGQLCLVREARGKYDNGRRRVCNDKYTTGLISLCRKKQTIRQFKWPDSYGARTAIWYRQRHGAASIPDL